MDPPRPLTALDDAQRATAPAGTFNDVLYWNRMTIRNFSS
jgi:hypothetical protein